MLKTRKNTRLPGYDYSQSGLYFVTICAQNRENLFGDIIGGKMKLNECGMIINENWKELTNKFNIRLDEYIIMPNHMHGIIVIKNSVGAGLVPARNNPAHDDNRATTRVAPTIGDIIGAFKSLTTHEYIMGVKNNGWKPFDKRLFQRNYCNYYEHIVRNEIEYLKIKKYIESNPLMWDRDRNNPTNIL